jgi:hypothetical protein
MPSRFDPPEGKSSGGNEPQEARIDTSKRYDIYCSERMQQLVVYRNARVKGIRELYKVSQFDTFGMFIELELANGQTVFILRTGLVKLCEPGADVKPENVPSG